jgi:hypothetical protein
MTKFCRVQSILLSSAVHENLENDLSGLEFRMGKIQISRRMLLVLFSTLFPLVG